jgi:hypothetical protein
MRIKNFTPKPKTYFWESERTELVFQPVFKTGTGQLKLSTAGSIPALSAIFFILSTSSLSYPSCIRN